MNLLRKEIKDYALVFLYWSIGILVMVGGGLGKYAGFSSSGSMNLDVILGGLPKIFLAIFGAVNVSYTNISGFYGIIYNWMVMMGAVFAVLLGTGILAKEERDKTAEFLMVKPISRRMIYLMKFLAALFYQVLFVGVTYALSVGLLYKVSPDDLMTKELMYMMGALLMIMVSFMSLSFMLASLIKQAKQSSQIGLNIVMVSYLLSVLLNMLEALSGLRFLVAFNWFPVSELVAFNFNPVYAWISILVSVVCFGLGLWFYPKRDLMI